MGLNKLQIKALDTRKLKAISTGKYMGIKTSPSEMRLTLQELKRRKRK